MDRKIISSSALVTVSEHGMYVYALSPITRICWIAVDASIRHLFLYFNTLPATHRLCKKFESSATRNRETTKASRLCGTQAIWYC